MAGIAASNVLRGSLRCTSASRGRPLTFGPTESSGNGPSGATGGSPPPPPGMIVFLCPSGHRLNGPAKLQGKAGQCPHCGAKFRIPLQDPDEEAAYQSQLAADQEDAAQQASQKLTQEPSDEEELSNEQLEEYHAEGEESGDLEEYSPAPEADLGFAETGGLEEYSEGSTDMSHSNETGWAVLFPYLWKQKSPGSEVDIFLADGTKHTPQWYSPSWSVGEQAVFAVRDTEGAYTILSVSWDAILRVEVRGVIDLPDGMFE